MAKFCCVMPLDVAEAFRSYSKTWGDAPMADIQYLGQDHLLLAHDVLKSQENIDLYCAMYAGIPFKHVIMDNSVIEMGTSVDPKMILEAAEIVQAKVVVMPDALLDKDNTIQATMNGISVIGAELKKQHRHILAIPQGKDFTDWIKCLEHFADVSEIDWIGVPRNVNEDLGISRIIAVDACRILCPEKHIHMFGFSDDILDDMVTIHQHHDVIKSIDSAVPIRMGLKHDHKISLVDDFDEPRGDWWDNPGEWGTGTFRYIDCALANVERVRKWIK